MSSSNSFSPYVGLRPFREEDFQFFFGRDREIRVIASNLQTRPLTVLYGASGVGKSSVLQAGVVRRLKEDPAASVLYFREWQSDTLLQEVVSKAHDLAHVGEASQSATGDSDAGRAQNPAFLLLDQFEEFLLYHSSDSLGHEFDSALSRLINRKDCPVNVLIGIRDDSLSKLDRRFGLRIPNLLRDTLEVERLTPAGAKSAIAKPLAVFSKVSGDGKVYEAEPALVDEVLQQVQSGQVAVSESTGVGSRRNPAKESRIETAFLQLVLTKLWEEEQRRNSSTLRVTTLHELGGADNIVRSHVNEVMNQLASDRERDIAANMFRYLVTPSRSKIAQATKDLVAYAERPEIEVKKVLDVLTDRSESRILRKLSDPEQYEIFHDVLAQPLLDWRHARGEAVASKRLWRVIAGVGAVAVLLGLLAIYALVERHRARDAAELARTTQLKAESAQKEAQANLAQLQSEKAASEGNKLQATLFRTQAEDLAKQATTISLNYQNQQQNLDSTSKQAFDSIQAANRERDAMQKERDDYKSQLQAAQELVRKLQDAETKPQAEKDGGTAQRKPAQALAEASSNKSSPARPAGLTATLEGNPAPVSASRVKIGFSFSLDAGTEICGFIPADVSARSYSTTKVSALILDPSFLGEIEGNLQLASPAGQSLPKDSKYPPSFRLEFDTMALADRTTRLPISSTLRSIKSGNKKHQLTLDGMGNINSLSLPKFTDVCISLDKPVSFTSPK